jgi:hypothetical protein
MSTRTGRTPVVRTFLVLGGLVVVLAAPGCGGGDGGDETNESAPAPATTTTAASGDLEVYEVESAGFALGVPQSWNATSVDDFRESGALEEVAEENPNLAPFLEALQQPDSVMKFIAGDPELREKFSTNVNVIVEDLPDGVDAEAYEQANLTNIRQGLRLEGDIAESRIDTEAGEALRIAYEHRVAQGGQELALSVVQVILSADNRGYVVTYSTVPSALADYEPTFDESARSFRLL